jgi:purine nucleoside phosphorylase
MAAGVLPKPLSHDEVLETTRRASPALERLLEEVVARLKPEA